MITSRLQVAAIVLCISLIQEVLRIRVLQRVLAVPIHLARVHQALIVELQAIKKAEQQEVLLRASHLAVRPIRAIRQVKRVVHITPMMMDMIQFTMMAIMIMTDTTVTQIMLMA
ncbi:hypothetical protein [Eubacterium ventriosum]|mgnify:CR=1 FL=1|uniref:hypothetical protein n=1 Tax=Eubacterium ventriosum TaxID=39496 RepID=UPI001C0296CC|nr:hypothetical protein [Eubacterium ventriosum]MBT9693663.1 hypothetical protein [Eubacterium ventriosum]